jgi:hypothetical protein
VGCCQIISMSTRKQRWRSLQKNPIIGKNEVEDVKWVQRSWNLVSNHDDNLVFPFFYLIFNSHILTSQGRFILKFFYLLLYVFRLVTSVSPLHYMAFSPRALCCFFLGLPGFKFIHSKPILLTETVSCGAQINISYEYNYKIFYVVWKINLNFSSIIIWCISMIKMWFHCTLRRTVLEPRTKGRSHAGGT